MLLRQSVERERVGGETKKSRERSDVVLERARAMVDAAGKSDELESIRERPFPRLRL